MLNRHVNPLPASWNKRHTLALHPARSSALHGQVSSSADRATAKEHLLRLVEDTGRGFRATRLSRGAIEEAQVAVESLSGPELDYELLKGKWKLLFTTASDVVSPADTGWAVLTPV